MGQRKITVIDNYDSFVYNLVRYLEEELHCAIHVMRNDAIDYEILDQLKTNDINAEIFLDTKKNLGKQLTYANKRELELAIIYGENEFNENTVTIKNLKGVKGENNQTIPRENLINEIKKLI